MLHGSQKLIAETLCEKRSHQLGKGLQCGAAMPTFHHPSRSVYGSHVKYAEMSIISRSHQLGEGRNRIAEMPEMKHPSRLVLESQRVSAEMPRVTRSQGEGHLKSTEMSEDQRPPPRDRDWETTYY